nr:hypothetical protein BaRGS_034159 [Batillaria attramentaria]
MLGDNTVLTCPSLTNQVAVHHVRLVVPQRTINQGSEVSVTCISDGSKPAPDINWARRGADGKETGLKPPVLGQDIRLALDGKFLPESRLVRSGDKVTVSGISR